jgi:hypothetical protein
MGELEISDLSDESLADCFGRVDAERAGLEEARKALRSELLRRGAKFSRGRDYSVSVSISSSVRWDLDAVARELGSRSLQFQRRVVTTFVRAKAVARGETLAAIPDVRLLSVISSLQKDGL